jgi:ABC-type polysaccharide/polyol phosphate export permease
MNPLAWLLELYHSAIYWGQMPSVPALLTGSGAALALFAVGYGIFHRYALIFAEVV